MFKFMEYWSTQFFVQKYLNHMSDQSQMYFVLFIVINMINVLSPRNCIVYMNDYNIIDFYVICLYSVKNQMSTSEQFVSILDNTIQLNNSAYFIFTTKFIALV